ELFLFAFATLPQSSQEVYYNTFDIGRPSICSHAALLSCCCGWATSHHGKHTVIFRQHLATADYSPALHLAGKLRIPLAVFHIGGASLARREGSPGCTAHDALPGGQRGGAACRAIFQPDGGCPARRAIPPAGRTRPSSSPAAR